MSGKICPICGHKIIQRKGKYPNGTLILDENGKCVMIHKKCPDIGHKLSYEDSIDRSELLNQVIAYKTNIPKGYVADGKFSGRRVQNVTDSLNERGYSYKDQLYALNKIVKQQGGFYGIGALENNIAEIIYERDEIKKRKEQKLS